jgi:hypothetical protein
MPTQNGRAIPVWYAQDDRSRIEEAAVVGGYKHLSRTACLRPRKCRAASGARVGIHQFEPVVAAACTMHEPMGRRRK